VALDQLVGPFLEIEQRHQLAPAVLDLVTILTVQPGDEAQELGARQLLVDERTIGNESQSRFRGQRILSKVDTCKVDGARRRLEDSRDHAKRRRFTGAIRPQESEQLAIGNRQIYGIDCRKGTVFLG